MTFYSERAIREAVTSVAGHDAADEILGRLPAFERSAPVNAVRIRARGRELSIREWALTTGINEWTIRDRIRRGWPPHRAVTVRPQRGAIREGFADV